MILGALISIALGILSVMILFSLTATALQEAIAQLLNTRGKRLRDGIVVLLEQNFPDEIDPKRSLRFFYDQFYQAAELNTLTTRTPSNFALRLWDRLKLALRGGDKKLPSAIEPRRYAEAVFKLLGNKTERNALALQAQALVETGEKQLLEQLKSASAMLGDKGIGDEGIDGAGLSTNGAKSEKIAVSVADASDAIQEMIGRAQSLVEARLHELEEEFNQTMDRVSGWFTRQVKMTLFLIGLFLAMGANIDLIGYAQRLLTDENLRNKAEIYAQLLAESQTNQPETGALGSSDEGTSFADGGALQGQAISPASLHDLVNELDRLDVQIGWCEPIPTMPDGTQPTEPTASGAPEDWMGLCQAGEQVRWPPSPSQIVGWFLIGFGVTLGGQFWFNLLRRLLDLRTSGRIQGTPAQAQQALSSSKSGAS